MNLKRTITALGVAALVACPAAATAKKDDSGGPAKGAAGADHGKGKSKKPKVRTYEFRGLVVATGAGSVQVAVSGGNSSGRKLKGQTVTFDLTKAKLKVADANKDGKRDLADVAAGDRVNVQAKVAGPVDPAQPVAARHFFDKGPVPAAEAPTPETPTPPAEEVAPTP